MAENTIKDIKSFRPPQDNIPKTKSDRQKLLDDVNTYVDQYKPVAPLSLGELRHHARRLLQSAEMDTKYTDYAAVLVSNAVWWPTVAGIPYNKRLLLLPKCMRDSENCPAQFDEIGLLCENCGRCPNDEFKRQAEQLGYAVLIAEGSPIVMSLVKTGKVDAIVGISCLSVLENVFPYMDAGAVPGIAIPLLYEGCKDTTVDIDWVWEAIYKTSEEETGRLNLENLRTEVDNWFTEQSLKALLAGSDSQVEKLAFDWLSTTGKRWRPFLATAVYKALCPAPDQPLPEDIKKIALAVECFHKASLIHDDIEDGDDYRYGRKTMHARYGVPIALNVGDFLLGEGYRLLTDLDAPGDCKIKMLAVAAQGHRTLCLGQGDELSWMSDPQPLSPDDVIDIFRNKTSPAFEVALKLGALYAGCDDAMLTTLKDYSDALGIAYQIRDDIEEFFERTGTDGVNALKPSLLLAIAYTKANDNQKKLLKSLFDGTTDLESARDMLMDLQIPRAASDRMELYKSRALSCLARLTSPDLKGLLRRVISKIFKEIDVMGCCNDYKAGHDKHCRQGEESTD